jgi:hypothetical protein
VGAEQPLIAAGRIEHADRFQVPPYRIAPHRIAPRQKSFSILSCRSPPRGFDSTWSYIISQRSTLIATSLIRICWPGGGTADLGFKAFLNRIGELARVRPEVEVGQ